MSEPQTDTQLLSTVTRAVSSVIPDGEILLVGVSGGVDSVVLMEILARAGRWPLVIAHCNHALRGEEADLDQALVIGRAKELGLAVVARQVDVRGFCAENRVGIEEGARHLRHQFLSEVAAQHGANAIVLAHHADDQVETVLFNFIRGSTARGLGGMAAWDEDRRLLRPLLDVTKTDIIAYATAHGLSWRHDATNDESDFDRNWLRNDIIPEITSRRPGFAQVVRRMSKQQLALHNFLADASASWLREQRAMVPVNCLFEVERFLALPAIQQGEVLAQIWEQTYGSRQGFVAKRAEEVANWMERRRNGGNVYFGEGARLLNRNGYVGVTTHELRPKPSEAAPEIPSSGRR